MSYDEFTNYTTVPIYKDARPDSIHDAGEEEFPHYEIREQDRYLPLANVARIMKTALPPQAKLSKDSKMCVQECVSEFVSFITSAAVDRSQAEKRKTLNGEDILYALDTLGFENYALALKIYLAKFRAYEQRDADDRRDRDRQKRQLRKQRKEREEALELKKKQGNDATIGSEQDPQCNPLQLEYSYKVDGMEDFVLSTVESDSQADEGSPLDPDFNEF